MHFLLNEKDCILIRRLYLFGVIDNAFRKWLGNEQATIIFGIIFGHAFLTPYGVNRRQWINALGCALFFYADIDTSRAYCSLALSHRLSGGLRRSNYQHIHHGCFMLGPSYDCPSANEITTKEMDKTTSRKPQSLLYDTIAHGERDLDKHWFW